MRRCVILATVVCLLGGACRRETDPPPILVRYAGVNEDTENIINDRIKSLIPLTLLRARHQCHPLPYASETPCSFITFLRCCLE